MQKSISILLTAGIISLSVTAALAQTAPATTADTSKGKALVDGKGMTLYTFDTRHRRQIELQRPAAPPIGRRSRRPPTPSRRGDWTIVTRDDGGKQWAYKGKPLYDFQQGRQARRRHRRRRQQRLAHRRAVTTPVLRR